MDAKRLDRILRFEPAKRCCGGLICSPSWQWRPYPEWWWEQHRKRGDAIPSYSKFLRFDSEKVGSWHGGTLAERLK
ncbi:hypothetical protein RchiOBHm_Chr5g0073801 [Rosa chinensis]|uniref:Uncharacterized protein n=1 Tax=Rosa chinensis TaxID=74649 RepID=A0A2P6QL09_ROSCH|nr:hypothetical protein RchiOBHm_Chr5g0073801 [Rosa chinensis]